MEFNIKVKKIILLWREGYQDSLTVFFDDSVASTFPALGDEACFDIHLEHGYGIKWTFDTFGIRIDHGHLKDFTHTKLYEMDFLNAQA